jgi:hypothetical protein
LTTIDRPHPTPILRKKIEDLREAGATFVTLRRFDADRRAAGCWGRLPQLADAFLLTAAGRKPKIAYPSPKPARRCAGHYRDASGVDQPE